MIIGTNESKALQNIFHVTVDINLMVENVTKSKWNNNKCYVSVISIKFNETSCMQERLCLTS